MNHYYNDDNANIEEENVIANDVPTPLVNHIPLKEIDCSICDALIEENMYLDMKSNQLHYPSCVYPTWKYATYTLKIKDSYTQLG